MEGQIDQALLNLNEPKKRAINTTNPTPYMMTYLEESMNRMEANFVKKNKNSKTK